MARGITPIIIEKARKIKLLLMDVDGVLTDGNIYYLENSIIARAFNVKDGLGIDLARAVGLKTGLISAKDSDAVRIRAKELCIDFIFLGVSEKDKIIDQLINDWDYKKEEIAYIGDDLIDIPVYKKVGLAIAVNDAAPEVIKNADFTTFACGGQGAVREAIEVILKAQGSYENLIKKYL